MKNSALAVFLQLNNRIELSETEENVSNWPTSTEMRSHFLKFSISAQIFDSYKLLYGSRDKIIDSAITDCLKN